MLFWISFILGFICESVRRHIKKNPIRCQAKSILDDLGSLGWRVELKNDTWYLYSHEVEYKIVTNFFGDFKYVSQARTFKFNCREMSKLSRATRKEFKRVNRIEQVAREEKEQIEALAQMNKLFPHCKK